MSKDWKIYTKTGDHGTTSLIGGERVQKFDKRIEAYGTVDELNSWIGLIRDQNIDKKSSDTLLEIQDRLFTTESQLAVGSGASAGNLPFVNEGDVIRLEKEIDRMNDDLPELTSFILPGGATVVSFCHLARTVCRRAERTVLEMNTSFPVDQINIKYLNRLSDYLFVLSRKLAKDQGVKDTPWNARK